MRVSNGASTGRLLVLRECGASIRVRESASARGLRHHDVVCVEPGRLARAVNDAALRGETSSLPPARQCRDDIEWRRSPTLTSAESFCCTALRHHLRSMHIGGASCPSVTPSAGG